MVRLDDQRGRLREPFVPGQDARVHVSVGGYDREGPRVIVQLARDAADGWIGIEKAVGFENGGHGLIRPVPSPGRTPAATASSPPRRPCSGPTSPRPPARPRPPP